MSHRSCAGRRIAGRRLLKSSCHWSPAISPLAVYISLTTIVRRDRFVNVAVNAVLEKGNRYVGLQITRVALCCVALTVEADLELVIEKSHPQLREHQVAFEVGVRWKDPHFVTRLCGNDVTGIVAGFLHEKPGTSRDGSADIGQTNSNFVGSIEKKAVVLNMHVK